MKRCQRRRSRKSPSDDQQENSLWHDFSDDLLLKIQILLPAKQLFKFMCVSKHWLDRISRPSFLEMHQDKSKNNPILLFRKNSYHDRSHCTVNWHTFNPKTNSFSDSFTTKFKVYEVVTISFLGLICFKGSKNDWRSHDQIFLCNPSTKHILELPEDKSVKSPEDPIRGFGFGYLSSTQTYKVVQLFNPGSEDLRNTIRSPMKCEVIEVTNSVVRGGKGGTGSCYSNWRIVEDCPCLADFFLSSALIGESMYWETNLVDLIVCFNIKTEKFGTVNYPNADLPGEATAGKRYSLLDLEGQLGIASLVGSCMEIWKLHENKGSVWERRYTIPLKTIYSITGSSICMRPIYFLKKEIVMYSVVSEFLVFYNPEKHAYRTQPIPKGFKPSGVYHDSVFGLGVPVSSLPYSPFLG